MNSPCRGTPVSLFDALDCAYINGIHSTTHALSESSHTHTVFTNMHATALLTMQDKNVEGVYLSTLVIHIFTTHMAHES